MVNKKKVLIALAVVAIICVIGGLFAFNNKVDDTITCYTKEIKAYGDLPVAQESRQFYFQNEEEVKAFEEALNVELSDIINKDILKDKDLLIMISNDVVKCELTSVFIDDQKQPHMMVEKMDDGTELKTWIFIASIDKNYAKKLDLSRWNTY